MIATIIAASVFTAAALQQLYSFQNAMKDVGSRNQDVLSSSITVIAEASASSPDRILIWIKNTGHTSFGVNGSALNATFWDLFITFPDGTYTRFSYAASCSSDCWTVQILNDKGTIGVWEEGETVEITVYPAAVPSGSYAVRLALPNGVTCEDKFSLS
jgi:archaellum component FlaG (FlaF/FlaG flagellin family)